MIAIVLLACALTVTDGDTLRCGRERIRLLGIDAPELPGHCRRGRRCAPGDPIASRRALVVAVRGAGPVTIERRGQDHYGRTLAHVRIGQVDLGCYQLAQHRALYRPRWDDGGEVRTRCPAAAARSAE